MTKRNVPISVKTGFGIPAGRGTAIVYVICKESSTEFAVVRVERGGEPVFWARPDPNRPRQLPMSPKELGEVDFEGAWCPGCGRAHAVETRGLRQTIKEAMRSPKPLKVIV